MDTRAQMRWLIAVSRRRFRKTPQQLVLEDYSSFAALAKEWRERQGTWLGRLITRLEAFAA